MTWSDDTLVDLLTCCESAPDFGQRSAAAVLLARELVAGLSCTRKDYRKTPNRQDHFGYLALSDLGLAEGGESIASWAERTTAQSLGLPLDATTLQKLMRAPSRKHGARNYFSYRVGHAPWATVTAPRAPAPASTLTAARTEAETLGGELTALVEASMAPGAFAAARQPWLDELAFEAFAARSDVARFAVVGTAAPGAAFTLEVRGATSGYSLAGSEISVPAAGNYCTRLYGSVRSSATANPTAIVIALDVDGVEAGTYGETRNSTDPAAYVHFANEPAVGDIGGLINIDVGAGEVITVRNDTASDLYAAGILRVWRD